MAAEKQVNAERVAGKKRSRNKFKQSAGNTAAQPSAAVQQRLLDIGTIVNDKSIAVEPAPQMTQEQTGPSGRKSAGKPATNGTAETPSSKRHKKDQIKQDVKQEAAVAVCPAPVAAEAKVHVPSEAEMGPAVVDGHRSSHAAAKKRSKNKFKQHLEPDAGGHTTVVPAVVESGLMLAVDSEAKQAGTSLDEPGKKRSKNKFKPQGSTPAVAQTIPVAEGSHSGAAARNDGCASGQAGGRGDVQRPQLCKKQLSGGVPSQGSAGQAGQRSGQPGALHATVGAGQLPSADRALPSRDVPVDSHIRHTGPASHGVPAVGRNRNAGGHRKGPGPAVPMEQRGSGAAVLPSEAAAGLSRNKRRRKVKGAVAQANTEASANGGTEPGLGEGGAAKTVQLSTVVAPPPKGAAGSANWAVLKAVIGAGSGRKRKRPGPAAEGGDATAQVRRPERMSDMEGLTPVLAVDCEMVGVGADGVRSSLARVCVVNSAGNVLLDEHVAQKECVTDYRTRFSGIRPRDLVGAPGLEEVQQRVADMFKGRIVVGHAITNDLTALLLSHPRKLIRDTARFPPLMRATAPGRRPKPRALRQLALEHLGLTIQEGEHSPVDDARAALYLYQKHRKEWEMHIERGTISQLKAPGGEQQPGRKKGAKTLEELAAADDMVDL